MYTSPNGYLYEFEGDEFDESWDHDNLSDAWDGFPIGQDHTMPGGVSFRELNEESFVRLQDPGDPRDHEFGDDPSNRKLTFSRNMQNDFSATDGLILDAGVTIHFRIRLSTGLSGPLDGVFPDGGGAPVPVPLTGDGLAPDFGGFGHIQIHQGTDRAMGNIGFSLAVAAGDDPDGGGAPNGPGLIMNSLNGSVRSVDVDLDQGIRNNIHPVGDPTQWQEFWITIRPNTQFFSTHRLQVFHNGAAQPEIYFITAGSCDCDAPGAAGIALSGGYTTASSAIDIDFVRVIEGVVIPVVQSSGPLEFLGIDYGPVDEPIVTIAWLSRINELYTVERSIDLVDWIEIENNIPSEGEITFFEDPEAVNAQQYYRVKSNP